VKKKLFAVLAAAALIGGALALTPSAQAKPEGLVINVNNHSLDEGDATPGNGACETANGNGVCTLRAAVQESNALLGAEVINLEAGQTYTLTRPGFDATAVDGDLDILGDVTINGNNSTVDANGGVTNDRAFEVRALAVVILSDLTIENGSATAGGGVANFNGTLALNHVTVTGNSAANGGGGIYSTGQLNVVDSTIIDNHVTNNQSGGGLYLNGDALIHNSAILNNTTPGGAGGIYASGSIFYVSNSTISGNRTDNSGGGIASSAGTMRLLNVTIADNYADNDNNDSGVGGGIYRWSTAVIYLNNSILANNFLENGASDTVSDCSGALTSSGYNIVRSTSGCTITPNTGDKFWNDPKLGTLADHGGWSLTYDLQAASPAIDAGNPNGCFGPTTGSPTLLTSDQREYSRPANGGISSTCDMGAFEYNGAAPMATVTPTPTPPAADPCASKPSSPALVSPAANASVSTAKVPLDWTDTNCATTYKVLVKQDSKQGIKVAKKGGLIASQYTTPKLTKGHIYFWKTWACNAAGCVKSPWAQFNLQ
jgi:predicted outer membrane repeat protein